MQASDRDNPSGDRADRQWSARAHSIAGAVCLLIVAGTVCGAASGDEAASYEQIKRWVADPPSDENQPDAMTVLAARREKAIALIDAFLQTHPRSTRRDELLMDKLESLYIVTIVRARPLDALEAEADRVLSGRPSPDVAAYAAYLKMQARIAAHRRTQRLASVARSGTTTTRGATTTQPVTTSLRAPRGHEQFLVGQYRSYVNEYPKSQFTPRLLVALIQEAWARGDDVAATEDVARLKRDHPRHVETGRIIAALRARRAIGKPFELTFTGMRGEKIDMKMMRGQVVLIGFWASWCQDCRRMVARLESLRRRYQGRGLRTIGVSLDGSRSAVEAFLSKEGIDWPQHFDGRQWDNVVARRCGVQSIPSILVIDTAGLLRAISPNDVEGWVARLLAERK